MDLEDEDLDELIGERYPWRAVGPLMKQEWRIMETLGDMEDDFKKAEKKIERGVRWAAKRYGPELKAWGESDIVKAKKLSDKIIEKSKYGQNRTRFQSLGRRRHDLPLERRYQPKRIREVDQERGCHQALRGPL